MSNSYNYTKASNKSYYPGNAPSLEGLKVWEKRVYLWVRECSII